MCLLIETIKIFNGEPQALEYHQKRFNKSCKDVIYFNNPPQLQNLISCPDELKIGITKCRISYGPNVLKIDYERYTPKTIKTLKIVYNNNIIYNYKFADRTEINKLYHQKGNFDDILIVKNNLITDTSICNIVLYDGTKYFTPALPLLKGTMRQCLIDKRIIFEDEINLNNIKLFKQIIPINAMIGFDKRNTIKNFNTLF